MNIQTIGITNSLWMEILEKIPHDVYQLPEYLALEGRRTKSIPEAILISDGDKFLFLPYLLRNCNILLSNQSIIPSILDIVSPYGYPGFLINYSAANSPDFLALAVEELKEFLSSKNVCSAFFRLHTILNANFDKLFPTDTFTPNGQTVSINLKLSEQEIWAHTRKGHQSTINKCKRLGLTARIVSFAEYYDEFTAIYHETMQRVQASNTYYFEDCYFQDLFDLGARLHLCIVELEGKVVSSSLFFECCGIVQAHLGGTKSEFLSQSPFNLLLHHARIWAKTRGNEFLHIGGGIGGTSNDSLFTFKSGFSRQRHNFFTWRLIANEEKYLYLTELQAKNLGVSVKEMFDSNFFPAYRYVPPIRESISTR